MITSSCTLNVDGGKNTTIAGNHFLNELTMKMDYSKCGSSQTTILSMSENESKFDFTIGPNTFALVVIVNCRFVHLIGPICTPLLIDQKSYDYIICRQGIEGFSQITIDDKMAQDISKEKKKKQPFKKKIEFK